MAIGKGQLYRASSFDLGFINMIPVDVVLQIMDIDPATNELELAFVSAGVCSLVDAGAAIRRWFKEAYPSRSKENCLLKNVRAFEGFVNQKLAIPEPCTFAYDLSPSHSSMPEDTDIGVHKIDLRLNLSISSPTSSSNVRE
jgi:hypothetical protein